MTLTLCLKLARKYKTMGLPVQRRTAVTDYLFLRRAR